MASYETNGIEIELKDNSESVLQALKYAINRGLSACGERASSYAKGMCPVDTGALRNSITYSVQGEDCYIGTNLEYGKYVEFGTGVYAKDGGRRTSWVYVDKDGNFWRTNGQKAQPFLRPSASDHGGEYKDILINSLRNA